jgi:hypothetical protein
MKRTVKISKDGRTITQKVIVDSDEYFDEHVPLVGRCYAVATRESVVSHNVSLIWEDGSEYIMDGFPGNFNRTIRLHHGWRGTTNDASVFAHGVRQCLTVNKKTYKNGKEHFVMIFGPEIEYGSEEHLAAIEKAKVLDEHRRLRQRALNAELAEVSYDDPQWYEKTFTIECKYA